MLLRLSSSWFLLILCTLIFCAVSSAAESSKLTQPEKYEVSPEKMGKVISNIDLLLSQIDRSQFDIDALIEKLSFDENEIIQFVSREIAFEDYPGTLRGATGTLQSRAGNSLDQAILLARMLNDIGLDARIVEGEISRSELMPMLLEPRIGIPGSFLDQAELLKISSEFSQGSSSIKPDDKPSVPVKDKVKINFKLPEDVSNATSMILSAIEQEGVDLGSGYARDIQNKAPYYWVEYRDSQSIIWKSVHPVFKNAPGKELSVKAKSYFTGKIGADLQQKIKVQAFIDRSWNGNIETIAVTPVYEYPAANLSGLTFSYTLKPISSSYKKISSSDDAKKAVETSSMFVPLFDFGSAKPKLAFDISGNVMPVEEATSAMAPLFQQVGKRFGSAADALATDSKPSIDASNPNRYIVRHWLKFTISRPGLEPKVIVRDVAQWKGDETLFKKSLARVANFHVESGAVSAALFLNRRLNAVKRIAQSFISGRPLNINDEKQQKFSLAAEVFLLSSDEIARQNSNTILYRAEPAIVARYSPYGYIDADREGFDILNAPRHAVSSSTGQTDVKEVLQAGVTDTWLEHALFAGEYWQQSSAFGQLMSRTESSGSLTVLTQSDKSSIQDIPLHSQQLVKQSLDNSDLIILAGKAESCDSWWRINPQSGEGLGMLSNGWGGVNFLVSAPTSEYIADLTAIYGGTKVGGAMLSCGAAIAGLRASVGLAALRLFEIDEAMGFQNLNLCAQIPSPGIQALCTAIVAGAAAASQAPIATLSNDALMTICLKFIFS